MGRRWTVVIGTSVRARWRQHLWGDTHFAEAVARELQALGWTTRVHLTADRIDLARGGNLDWSLAAKVALALELAYE